MHLQDHRREDRATILLKLFTEALENIMPVLEVKARRVGGSTYQVPMEVQTPSAARRSVCVGSTHTPRQRSEKTMAERLADEIIDAKRRSRRSVQEERRNAQNGRGQQGVCSLSDIDSAPCLGHDPDRARQSTDITQCQEQYSLERTRNNIGIMAHIDAGKTTTTERILFYTGKYS